MHIIGRERRPEPPLFFFTVMKHNNRLVHTNHKNCFTIGSPFLYKINKNIDCSLHKSIKRWSLNINLAILDTIATYPGNYNSNQGLPK